MSGTTCQEGDEEPRCPHCHRLVEDTDEATEAGRCHVCGGSARGEPSSEDATVDEARTLGRFQLLECVGSGTFGAVWRARDPDLDRLVALKIPHPNILENENLRERFRREARAAARLRHPGIVPLHEVLDLEGQIVLVSDYIDGLPLKKLLGLRRLSFRQAAALVADIADALEHAHSQGLIHRDIKPDNILIEPAHPDQQTQSVGRALIVDFGLALREEAEVVLTIDGQLLGTPGYMSPEQAAGRGHRADRRSDVYSLGVILYELLTGERPFRGTRAVLLHQVIHDPPQSPRRLNERVPLDLETICLKTLAKEPLWRYQTAAEFAADLRRYLRNEPVLARPLGPLLRLWLWRGRNPALAASIAVASTGLLALLVLATTFALREWHNARQLALALEKTNAGLRQAEYRLSESYFHRGLALCDQNNVGQGLLWLALALKKAPADAPDLRHYLRLSLSAWQSRHCSLKASLAGSDGVRALSFAPDGRSGLILGYDGMAYPIDVATGASTRPPFAVSGRLVAAALTDAVVVTGHSDGKIQIRSLASPGLIQAELPYHGPSFSLAVGRDASTIVAFGDGHLVTIWGKQDGGYSSSPITVSHEGRVRCVAVSPDGRWVLSGGENRLARLWDSASGELLHELKHDDAVLCAAFGRAGEVIATGSLDGTVQLWETGSGKPLDFRVTQEQSIRAVAVSDDGRFVLSGGLDRTARLWSVATRQPIGSPLLHADSIMNLAIAPDGSRILTGSGKNARLWMLPPGDGVVVRTPGQGWVRSLAFSSDGKMLLTGDGVPGEGGTARLWDGSSGELLGSPLTHGDLILATAFSPDDQTIATAGADGKARLADVRTGQPGPILPHEGPIYILEFNAAGTLLLTAGEDRVVRLWNPKTGQLVGQLPARTGAIMTAGFSPSGDLFFSGSDDGRLGLWRTTDLAPLFLPDPIESILTGTFNHDGTRLALASGNRAFLFDVRAGRFLDPPLIHPDKVRKVAFSPDDRVVLVAGDDGTARFWDADARIRRGVALTHAQPVSAAVYSPDGRLILTGTVDGTVQLWDATTGRSVGPPSKDRGRISAARFSPDGTRYAIGSSGKMCLIRPTPRPWPGEPEEISREIEILTGLEIDDSEGLRVLDPATWNLRARKP